MNDLTTLEPWWRFGAALLVGALIGLEREFIQQRKERSDFAGLRTFALISLLGAIAAFLAEQQGVVIFIAILAGIIVLVLAGYLAGIYLRKGEGITTEVAAFTVYLLGAMMIWSDAELAIGVAVIVTILLSLKPRLQGIVRRMSVEDMRISLQFALIAGVILPILPRQPLDPLGVVNPFEIWLLVVFVSAIGFGGYILNNVLGAKRGIGLTGALGGLVSSTATTISFASRSRETPSLSDAFAMAIILASTVMLPRIFILVGVVNPGLLGRLALPLGAMLVANLLFAAILWRQVRQPGEDSEPVQVTNPLRMSTAVTFGLLFAVVLVAVKLADNVFGRAGVYVASALAGVVDVNAITLSVSDLAARAQIDTEVAAVAIVLAALVNTATKGATALALGAPRLRRLTLTAFGITIAAGVVGTAISLAGG